MNHSIGLAVAMVALGTLTMPAVASDPLGVFCIVDKVVLEPPDCPEKAQVWGACAVAKIGNQFGPAAKGYFYYSIPAGKEDVVRAEWMDLKATAGTGAVIGYGGRIAPAGRFRMENEKPASPDPYPLNTGVVKLSDYFARDYYRGVADQLRALVGR
jgi:hypothetical protein